MLSLRTLLRHPIQFAIMTLGIALGVAVMVGIDIANASASRAFDMSTTAVTGRATHAIVAGAQGVDESFYVRLRTDPFWRGKLESAPLVIKYAVSPQLDDLPFTLLGIDPFAEAPFRSYLGTGDASQRPSMEAIASLLTVPGSVLLSAPTAERYGLRPCPPDAVNESCLLDLYIGGELLTPRQMEVLSLCAAYPDASTSDLAQMMSISNSTVRNLLSNLYLRLGVHSRTAAVEKAREMGLVTPRPPSFAA